MATQGREIFGLPPAGGGMGGSSSSSQKVQQFISQMAGEKNSILIEGESGTGKEVVAQLLRQSQKPFVAINVAAISESLF